MKVSFASNKIVMTIKMFLYCNQRLFVLNIFEINKIINEIASFFYLIDSYHM